MKVCKSNFSIVVMQNNELVINIYHQKLEFGKLNRIQKKLQI